jgi:hypothetical protein
MKTIKFRHIIIILMILATAVSFGETLTVGKGGKYKEIQAAIDAAADGDVIVIKAGNYSQSGSLYLSSKTNLTIKGEGKVNIACTQYLPVFYLMSCKGITIRAVHGYHKIKDPEVGKGGCGPGATIITAEGCTGISILNCELNGCGQTGFEAYSTDKIVLDGNYIHDNVFGAVDIYLPQQDEQPEIRIENNKIENNYSPVIFHTRSGLLNMYFNDITGQPGIVMKKNKWKNNDLMPNAEGTVNGQKIVFRGKPNSYKDGAGNEIIYSGILNADTSFTLGGETITFLDSTYVYFYENGSVQTGFSAEEVPLTVDEYEYTIPITGKMDFYESGAWKSAELEDGSTLQFTEDGDLKNMDNNE